MRLDPFNLGGPGGDALNPIDFLPPSTAPDFLDLANMLVVRQGTEREPHWDDSAERVITVFVYYVAACETDPAKRNLLSVRSIIRSRDVYSACLNVMKQVGGSVKQQAESLSWLQDR